MLWQLQQMLALHAWRNTRYAWSGIVADTQGNWWLQNRQGVWCEASLCDDSFITKKIMILNFKPLAGQRLISLILFQDSFLGSDEYRRLQVKLLLMHK